MSGKGIVKIERAIISVSDKSDIVKVAKKLNDYNVEIISTGGTAKVLREAGVPITPIEEITGNPESFDGRMKSLSFEVSSGLLFRRDDAKDIEDADNLNIKKIDLVICNLYPFNKMYTETTDINKLVDLIDVGGPTMIRSGAKNFRSVLTVTSISQYDKLLDQLSIHNGGHDQEIRNYFAADAFKLLSGYDRIINVVLMKKLECGEQLRYGENSHQEGWVLSESGKGLAGIIPIQGKRLSYNNYLDSDSAINVILDLIKVFPNKRSVVIIKHSNPCGMAVSNSVCEAFNLAWASDPISSFGSVIAISTEINEEIALNICNKFVEVIIAPSFSKKSLEIFSTKKNLRLIEYDFKGSLMENFSWKSINGGMLVQEIDRKILTGINVVTEIEFGDYQIELIPFSQIVVKHLKSNAICIVKKTNNSFQLIGAGMGNPNRLISSNQALEKAKENGITDFREVLVASDAFFPFADNIELLATAGVKYIIQPGGSIKDREVIDTCNRLGISMSFTGIRHFLH